MSKLIRPNDKAIYAPIRTTNQNRQTMRDTDILRRMTASTVRPEKKNGLRR